MSYYLEINYEPDEDNMSKIWEPQSIEVYIFWADAIINEAQDKLNNWEIIFIASIQERLEQRKNLTQAQANKLEDIYAKYTE